MKLSNLNEWLTLTANIGVLAGIIVLAAELQQSNQIALRDARTDVLIQIGEVESLVLENPQLASLRVKLQESSPQLTDEEREQARALAGKIFVQWSIISAAYEANLLTEAAHEAYLNVALGTMRSHQGLRPFISEQLRFVDIQTGEYGPIYDAILLELN